MRSKFLYDFVIDNQITKIHFLSYCAIISLTVYFLIITAFGDRGLLKLASLQNYLDDKSIIKEDLTNRVQSKRAMVNGMGSYLDLDLLDEQSRKVLGYVGRDEIVIYQNKN